MFPSARSAGFAISRCITTWAISTLTRWQPSWTGTWSPWQRQLAPCCTSPEQSGQKLVHGNDPVWAVDPIAQYIAQDNPARATSFVKELRQSTAKLANFPGMGRAGRVHGTRELVIHQNYLAIYRVRASDVEILRIHHVARKL
jgi:toxin ParE1/3/4